MEPGFWHEKWQLQQIGFHQQEVNSLLLQHWPQLAFTEESRIFVPLCGKSLDMCYLAERGHDVLGCELSEAAVQQFFTENGLTAEHHHMGEHQVFRCEQICLYQGDIFSLPAIVLKDIGGFYDRAALIAWPPQMREQYARQLARLIPTGCQGLLITLDYPQQALSGPPFAVSCDWIQEHMGTDFDVELLESRDVLQDNPRFVKKQVPWLRESAYRLVRRGN
jgi:thiopurine S-methyltransferase